MLPWLKTVDSIIRARLLGIMISCALLAGILVFVLAVCLARLTDYLVKVETGWLDSLINWLAGIVAGLGGWFMLPALIVLIAGVFQEKVIDRVEREYYPTEVRQHEPTLWPDFVHDIRFTLKALFLNILVLPFYLLGVGPVFSIALNSYLLGREFFESAAGYHLGKPEARRIEQYYKLPVYSGGLIITLISLVPIVNLFIPILAVVWMVHLYHGLLSRASKEGI
ncbi:MAG: EI24 domain-containing protein [Thermodesulfobacteriota bacterium]